MIGFEISATSNIGFNRTRGGWTEGSFWLAKSAVGLAAPKGSGMFTPDFVSAIEGKFTVIKDHLLKKVGAIDNEFLLIVQGDIMLTARFDPLIPVYMNTWRLVRGISLNDTDLRDQVMIQLCGTIVAFDEHITVFGHPANLIPLLTVTLKL